MDDGINRGSLRHPGLVIGGMLLLAGVGLLEASRMPLDVLPERPFGGGSLFFVALRDASVSFSEAIGDGFVQPVCLADERLPLVRDSAPRRFAFRFRRVIARHRQPLGVQGQFAEPGVDLAQGLSVLMSVQRAPARFVEARAD